MIEKYPPGPHYFVKLYLSVFFLSIISLTGFAQNNWPPVYLIPTDTLEQLIIPDSNLLLLEDKNGSYSFEQVRSEPLISKFHRPGIASAGIDTSEIHKYWFLYRVKNSMPTRASVSFGSFVNYYHLYIKKTGEDWKQYRSGSWEKNSERDGLKAHGPGFIPIKLEPGEELTIIDSRHNIKTTNFARQVRILSTEREIQRNYIDYVDAKTHYFGFTHLQEAFLIGVLLIAAAFSLFFYRVIHEKINLWFALFLLSLAVNRTYNIIGGWLSWEQPWNQDVLIYIGSVWVFIVSFMLLFFREVLQSKKLTPRLDKILTGLFWLNLLNYSGYFLINRIAGIQTRIFVLGTGTLIYIIPLYLLILCMYKFRTRERYERLMRIAAIPFLLFYGVIAPAAGLIAESEKASVFLQLAYWIQSHWRPIEIFCLLWLTLFFSGLLALRYSNLKKENAQRQLDMERAALEREIEKNALIQLQKENLEKEVVERTAELSSSLKDLKAAQAQLIHAEKMASLGELTAGIAHEIQNPLNFVNNFSDVNTELVEELKDELRAGRIDDALVIANDIGENESRISMHGKRADSIVKGMLQHSRSSSAGTKEETDLNNLVDEFLQLAYHGFRTKDPRDAAQKSFHADLHTEFDGRIESVDLVAQDIGRVLLNIINNALYALAEKKKLSKEDFKPTLHIRTKLENNKVIISIADNGTGIPQPVLEKIFQPFFTTKPTGLGTGLGLSLSYDIVKAHGGNIKVNSEPGKGSEFIIEIPAKENQ